MATITSAQSGNFSDTATWVGGVVPGASDDAVAATGHVVAIDVDVTVISVQQAGTGKFTLGNGRTLTGNVIANAGTFTSGGTVDVTATTTATINGNLSGVSSTASTIAAVVITGTGALTVNGSVTASPGSNSSEVNSSSIIYTNVNCTLTVNGALVGSAGNWKRNIRAGTSSTISLTINGNVTAGSSSSHAISISGPSPTINIIGNLTGGTDSAGIVSSGASTAVVVTGDVSATNGNASRGISINGLSSQITITGNILGGLTGTGNGINCGTGGNHTITVVGNVQGRGGLQSCGILFNANAGPSTISVTGQVIGGSGSDAHGIFIDTTSTITVIGTIQAGNNLGHGIRNQSTAVNTGVILQGNLIDSSQGVSALYTRIFRMTATNSGYTQYQNNVGYPLGSPVYRVSPDNVNGMPSASNVRKPVAYGYTSELTGAMTVPVAGSVKFGVPVDNTVGTAELDLGRVAQIIGLQVAAGKSA